MNVVIKGINNLHTHDNNNKIKKILGKLNYLWDLLLILHLKMERRHLIKIFHYF